MAPSRFGPGMRRVIFTAHESVVQVLDQAAERGFTSRAAIVSILVQEGLQRRGLGPDLDGGFVKFIEAQRKELI